jgi:hypothetical protein F3_01801|nr:MAG TPA: Homeodomain-like domain [Caudoviricetes sp.]
MCFFIVIFKNIVNITTLIKEKSYNIIETKNNGGVFMKLELVQAKRMYADNKSIDEIASALNKSKGTVYRWIKEHKEEFEEARKLKELSVDDMGEILDEAHKKMLLNIIENPETLVDPKVADSLIKIANVLEKMDKRREKEKKEKQQADEEERGVLILDDIKEEEKAT